MSGQDSHVAVPEIDWMRLASEFRSFEPDADCLRHGTSGFVGALVDPVPRFVRFLLQKRLTVEPEYGEAVRSLYCFLLEKRYTERFNLLHFAFSIFDEGTALPAEIVSRTPFPHEDGKPSYKHHHDPDSVARPPESEG